MKRFALLWVVLVALLSADSGIYQKKKFSLDASTWTPIITPINCNAVGIKNGTGASILLRTDASDSNTEDSLPDGSFEVIDAATYRPSGSRDSRFVAGDVIVYAQMSAGTGTIVVNFLK